MKRYWKILLAIFALFSMSVFADEAAINLKPVQEFIAMMVTKHHFSKAELEKWFKETTIRQSIIDQMNKPAEAKPWFDYKNIFLDEARIQGGVDFWSQNKSYLDEAEKKYGVAPEIVIAIIGVETRYGKNQGRYPVLDALSTLAFAYPKREAFFRSELEHYLLFCREHKYNPTQLMGSYAGAMGGGAIYAKQHSPICG